MRRAIPDFLKVLCMFTFLLIVQTLVAAALVAVILMQRSEGGGLGVGGSSAGFMTARGAADFLTRATAILGGLFIVLSIVARGDRRRRAASRPTIDTVAGQADGRPARRSTAPAPLRPADDPAGPARRTTSAPAVPLAQ